MPTPHLLLDANRHPQGPQQQIPPPRLPHLSTWHQLGCISQELGLLWAPLFPLTPSFLLVIALNTAKTGPLTTCTLNPNPGHHPHASSCPTYFRLFSLAKASSSPPEHTQETKPQTWQ